MKQRPILKYPFGVFRGGMKLPTTSDSIAGPSASLSLWADCLLTVIGAFNISLDG
jgi:hypothetical protein